MPQIRDLKLWPSVWLKNTFELAEPGILLMSLGHILGVPGTHIKLLARLNLFPEKLGSLLSSVSLHSTKESL